MHTIGVLLNWIWAGTLLVVLYKGADWRWILGLYLFIVLQGVFGLVPKRTLSPLIGVLAGLVLFVGIPLTVVFGNHAPWPMVMFISYLVIIGLDISTQLR